MGSQVLVDTALWGNLLAEKTSRLLGDPVLQKT